MDPTNLPPPSSTPPASDSLASSGAQPDRIAPSAAPDGFGKATLDSPAAPAAAAGSSSRKLDVRRTKSRTGCRTCKKKRLKCDERKPTCEQCERRKVKCEGYARDFKWKSFEGDHGSFELTSITTPVDAEPLRKTKSLNPPGVSGSPNPVSLRRHASVSVASVGSTGTTSDSLSSSDLHNSPAPKHLRVNTNSGLAHSGLASATSQSSITGGDDFMETDSPAALDSAPASIPFSFSTLRGIEAQDQARPASPFVAPYTYQGSFQPAEQHSSRKEHMPLVFGDSSQWQQHLNSQGRMETPTAHAMEELEQKNRVERLGITRDDEPMDQETPSSPEPLGPFGVNVSAIPKTIIRPQSGAYNPFGDPKSMVAYFTRDTCEALSILGPDESNPWRDMIAPLIPSCAPLYHATAALTSFQILRDPRGAMVHMNKCVEYLSQGYHNMTYETAIATHLSMAFAESWNPLSPNSGHTHVQAARHLIRAAFDIDEQASLDSYSAPISRSKLLRFLCKTFVYLDVLLRLTSIQNPKANDFEAIMASVLAQARDETYLDPLMGCASTLFPILGHVANLVQKSCGSKATSPDWLRQAVALRTQLETWQPPSPVVEGARTSARLQSFVHLAEAYRNATLLHLRQGVPELPARAANTELAGRTLYHLSHVQIDSRATFVQIYPMLVAGSEAASAEERNFMRQRLRAMGDAMPLGCVLASGRVAEEVWKRRDRARAGYGDDAYRHLARGSAYMARGELHWLRVLADWNWQVLLG